MQLLQQSEATAAQRRIFFQAVDATDGISAETAQTGTGFFSKNGAAPAASSGSITELSATNMPGRYYIEATAAEVDTLGIIEFRFKAAATAEVVVRAQVVPYDPYDAVALGLSRLNADITSRSSHTAAAAGTDAASKVLTTPANLIDTEADGMVHADLKEWLGVAPLALVAQRVDGSVGAMAANVLTAAAIAAAAITDTKFAANAIDANAFAQAAADKVWSTTTRVLTAGTNLNDIAAGDVWAVDATTQQVQGTFGQAMGDPVADIATIYGRLDADVSSRLAPTVAARTLDIATGGEVGLDLDNTVGTIAAAQLAADCITAAKLAADVADEIRDAILPVSNAILNNIEFLWVAASDHVTPVTGASTTSVTRSIDGGAFGAATGTLAEVGNGIYQFDASAADMNGGIITFRFVATGGTPGAPDDAFLTIVTGAGV